MAAVAIAAGVSAAIAAVGVAVNEYQNAQEAKRESKNEEQRRQNSMAHAAREQTAGEIEAERRARAARYSLAEQRAGGAGRGLMADSGSALDVQTAEREGMDYDLGIINQNTSNKVSVHLTEAEQHRLNAKEFRVEAKASRHAMTNTIFFGSLPVVGGSRARRKTVLNFTKIASAAAAGAISGAAGGAGAAAGAAGESAWTAVGGKSRAWAGAGTGTTGTSSYNISTVSGRGNYT